MDAAKTLDIPRDRATPERPALDQVLDRIARDARDEPRAYAQDTRVPEGGE